MPAGKGERPSPRIGDSQPLEVRGRRGLSRPAGRRGGKDANKVLGRELAEVYSRR